MDNPVGSLEVPSELTARKTLCLSVSPQQREILIGCVLGDAYIAPLGKIRIEQSIKQKDYLAWKFDELKSLCYAGGPREITHVYRGKRYQSVFFLLRQYFRVWRKIFYQEKQKVFPDGLKLSPLSLAVWYMDDGCWTGKKIVISTESFKGHNVVSMQKALLDQFRLETKVGKNGKMVIRKVSHEIFWSLVSPHIVPSMKYKLPNPVTTCSEIVSKNRVICNRITNTLAPGSAL